jgi:hypothetical protein
MCFVVFCRFGCPLTRFHASPRSSSPAWLALDTCEHCGWSVALGFFTWPGTCFLDKRRDAVLHAASMLHLAMLHTQHHLTLIACVQENKRRYIIQFSRLFAFFIKVTLLRMHTLAFSSSLSSPICIGRHCHVTFVDGRSGRIPSFISSLSLSRGPISPPG